MRRFHFFDIVIFVAWERRKTDTCFGEAAGRTEDNMGKIRQKILGLVPEYGVMPLLIAVALNFTVYGGARVIAKGRWTG